MCTRQCSTNSVQQHQPAGYKIITAGQPASVSTLQTIGQPFARMATSSSLGQHRSQLTRVSRDVLQNKSAPTGASQYLIQHDGALAAKSLPVSRGLLFGKVLSQGFQQQNQRLSMRTKERERECESEREREKQQLRELNRKSFLSKTDNLVTAVKAFNLIAIIPSIFVFSVAHHYIGGSQRLHYLSFFFFLLSIKAVKQWWCFLLNGKCQRFLLSSKRLVKSQANKEFLKLVQLTCPPSQL